MRNTIQHPRVLLLLLLQALALLPSSTVAQSGSKRGYAYLGDTHTSDDTLLFSPNSSLAWYYNWSPTPDTFNTTDLPFLPLIHGVADAASNTTLSSLATLPASSTRLLTFNEPDGTTSSGGSAISPSDAAQAYLDYLVPLRTASSRTWNISHPATTGSDSGLAWLHEFNASCWELAPTTGCPTDFVALHWYGDFAGLASWLGTLREFYVTNASSGAVNEDMTFWVTEMALPDASAADTLAMLNESLTYLDGLDYVAGYAWYGVDRKGTGDWSGYTGGNVAVFNGEGALTDVGALYLGGEADGFKEGMKGSGAVRLERVSVGALVAAVVMSWVVVGSVW